MVVLTTACIYAQWGKQEELAVRIVKTITDYPEWLCFKNGDPKFKVEQINNQFTLFDAPENKLTWEHAAPKASRWGIGHTKLDH